MNIIAPSMKAAFFSLLYIFSLFNLISLFLILGSNAGRPPPYQRKFQSEAVDNYIAQLSAKMKDPDLAELFTNCFPNTLDTTVEFTPGTRPNTFVITGDIPAMWLRDSSGQVMPYITFANQDPKLKDMLLGIIFRQADSINIDVYANAFNFADEGSPHQGDNRHPPMNKRLFEGKYELDSLAWVMKLSAAYYRQTQDARMCTDSSWKSAIRKIYSAIVYQQKSTWNMSSTDPLYYSFSRVTTSQIDTLLNSVGVPGQQCGLSKSPFRPSDDAHRLPFPVAANAMASVSLSEISSILKVSGPCQDLQTANELEALSNQIKQAVQKWGIVAHPVHGLVYAYEVDGYGSNYVMDDANVPSLLSLPFLGYLPIDDPTYQRTRNLLLSNSNPYFFSGTAGEGIGGPHVGYGYIWPMSIINRALTTTNDSEILYSLNVLKLSSAGTGFMHESFWKDNPATFTRSWFAWCNSQFGELIATLAKTKPYLILKT
eukprot:TRINITY_DN9309_c0_g1_i1.p1 TRINITY_DN9309_c0_g1~~TRINITY_DN9309_c0_g1_i1.p1  ORF type:complete len:485 (-),score=72.55 TRINITY_DN9309_c0_g1_i1:34-1488(-)